MAANKLNNTQKIAVKALIAELRLKGKTIDQILPIIPRRLNGITLAHSTVCDYLKQLENEWMEDAKENHGKLKAQEAASLRMTESEAWDGYERSQQDAVTITTETIIPEDDYEEKPVRRQRDYFFEDKDPRKDNDKGTLIKEKKKIVGQAGNPSFINTVLNVKKIRIDLYGLAITKAKDDALDESQSEIKKLLAKHSENFDLDNPDQSDQQDPNNYE